MSFYLKIQKMFLRSNLLGVKLIFIWEQLIFLQSNHFYNRLLCVVIFRRMRCSETQNNYFATGVCVRDALCKGFLRTVLGICGLRYLASPKMNQMCRHLSIPSVKMASRSFGQSSNFTFIGVFYKLYKHFFIKLHVSIYIYYL